MDYAILYPDYDRSIPFLRMLCVEGQFIYADGYGCGMNVAVELNGIGHGKGS